MFSRDLPGETVGERKLLAALTLDALWQNRPATEVIDLARRSLGDGKLLEDGAHEDWAFWWTNISLVQAGEAEEAARNLEAGLEQARRRGAEVGMEFASMHLSNAFLQIGDLATAESWVFESIERGSDSVWVLGRPFEFGYAIKILVERGEIQRAAKLPARHEAEMDGKDTPLGQIWMLDARGGMELAAGNPKSALALYEEMRSLLPAGWISPSVLEWRSGMARAMNALGRPEDAAELANEDVRLAREFGASRVIGRALRVRGIIRGGTEGLDDLRESVEALEEGTARLEHAKALVELGAALRRANQRKEAREPLREGLELARRCGAAPLAERAREELKATGARPRKEVFSGVESLTASELRTARLAADGLTNREIAQQLYVTQKTVETHLRHCFQKLDLKGRGELEAKLAEEPQ